MFPTLREKCPNTELFLVFIFLLTDWIRRFTEWISVFSPSTGKYGPEITLYLDTSHAVTTSLNNKCKNVFWKVPFPEKIIQINNRPESLNNCDIFLNTTDDRICVTDNICKKLKLKLLLIDCYILHLSQKYYIFKYLIHKWLQMHVPCVSCQNVFGMFYVKVYINVNV